MLSNLSKFTTKIIRGSFPSIKTFRLLSTYYTDTHEWIKVSECQTKGTVGITNHAQESMGDVVFCDLEDVGESFTSGDIFGILESVKASSDIHLPVSGCIVEINKNVQNETSLINTSPMEDGWLVKIDNINKNDLVGLLSKDNYEQLYLV